MCVGNWSLAGFIHRADSRKVAQMPEIDEGEVNDAFEDGWDKIKVADVDG